MLDEAHERTVNSDVLLAIIKEIAKKRHGLRIIIMSATLQVRKFQDYFKELREPNPNDSIQVEGRTFPIQLYHALSQIDDYLSAAIRTVVQIYLFEPEGDILVFLTG